MLSGEHRDKKVKYNTKEIFQTLKERGYLFPQGSSTKDKIQECINAIKNPQIGIFLEDKRQNVQSTHFCVFITSAGHLVALPCSINEDHLHWYTIKDVKKEQNNPESIPFLVEIAAWLLSRPKSTLKQHPSLVPG